jgi:accessory gene regulator protein AgrB
MQVLNSNATVLPHKAWVTLTGAHDTCTITCTIVQAFIFTTNSGIAVMTTVPNFAYASSACTLASSHTTVWAAFHFRFTSFANITNVAKTFSKVALTTFRAFPGAWQFHTFHAVGTGKSRETKAFT